MTPSSRRALERDIAGLIEHHGMYSVLHALVEACHDYLRVGATRGAQILDGAQLCSHLRAAEHAATMMGDELV